MFTKKYPNVFDDCFIVNLDIDIKDITIQKEELDSVMWANLDKVIELINNNNFAINNIDFMKNIFELHQNSK